MEEDRGRYREPGSRFESGGQDPNRETPTDRLSHEKGAEPPKPTQGAAGRQPSDPAAPAGYASSTPETGAVTHFMSVAYEHSVRSGHLVMVSGGDVHTTLG